MKTIGGMATALACTGAMIAMPTAASAAGPRSLGPSFVYNDLYSKVLTSVTVRSTERSTSVSLEAKNFPRSAYGHTFGAHVHVNECGAGPDDAGVHYQRSTKGSLKDRELWLDLTVDKNGNAHSRAERPWAVAPGVRSVVVHAHPTNAKTGKAGDPILCTTVPFGTEWHAQDKRAVKPQAAASVDGTETVEDAAPAEDAEVTKPAETATSADSVESAESADGTGVAKDEASRGGIHAEAHSEETRSEPEEAKEEHSEHEGAHGESEEPRKAAKAEEAREERPEHEGSYEGQHTGRHEGQHEGRYDGQHPGRYEGQHAGRYEGQHAGRYEGQHEGRYEGQHPGRYEGRHEGGYDGQQAGRYEGRHEGRYEGRHEGRHDGRYQGRYEGRHEGRKEEYSKAGYKEYPTLSYLRAWYDYLQRAYPNQFYAKNEHEKNAYGTRGR